MNMKQEKQEYEVTVCLTVVVSMVIKAETRNEAEKKAEGISRKWYSGIKITKGASIQANNLVIAGSVNLDESWAKTW